MGIRIGDENDRKQSVLLMDAEELGKDAEPWDAAAIGFHANGALRVVLMNATEAEACAALLHEAARKTRERCPDPDPN